jgi:tetratricopeptide (TPR) repeat protein
VQAGRKKNLVWIATAVAVVLIAGAAGFGLRYMQNKNDPKTSDVPVAKPLQKNVGRAQDLAMNGYYDDAQRELAKALENPSLSKDDRFLIVQQQGTTFYNQGKYPEAIATYQEAAKIKETQSLYESIAEAATFVGNKELAIASYKKAIELIPSNHPLADDDKDSYEKKIKALEGQQ